MLTTTETIIGGRSSAQLMGALEVAVPKLRLEGLALVLGIIPCRTRM
jgi:hypothetical protein